MSWGWQGLVVGVALAASFFLSGMEAGVHALSPLRIRAWVRKGRPGARTLQGYLERPENFLWTILVGNTLANLVATGLVVAELQGRLAGRPGWFLGVFGAVCVVLYVAGDLLPKTLFRRFPDRLCLALVPVFRAVHLALAPMVALTERFARGLLRVTRGSAHTGRLFGNRDEFRALMQEQGGALTRTEQTLINRVMDLQNVTLARLTRPMASAVTVESGTDVTEVLRLCRERNVSRVPVWRGAAGRRRVVGIVRLSDLVCREGGVTGRADEHLRPALFLADTMRVEEALRRLQRGGEPFAVVVGPDGVELGIVTLWDVLRAMFGRGGEG